MSEEKMSDTPLAQGGRVASSEERQRNEGSIQGTVNENQAAEFPGVASNCGDRGTEGYSYEDDGTIVCNGCRQNFGVLEPKDDIDKIHAVNKPDCRLLLSRKGNKFIKQHQTMKSIEEVKERNTKDLEEMKNMVEEQNVVKLCKEMDRIKAENARLNRELQDTRKSSRQVSIIEQLENKFLADRVKQLEDEVKALKKDREPVTELKEEKDRIVNILKLQAGEMEKIIEFQNLQKKMMAGQDQENARLKREQQELKRENQVLSDKTKQQHDEIKELRDSVKTLSEEKARIVNLLKWQAGEMEKKIKECQELTEKIHGFVPKEAQEACISMGYTRVQVETAIGIYIQRHRANSSDIFEILLEMEENRQCSEQEGPGLLVVKGNRYGKGDGTKCYYCGTGLMNWLATDEPWFEHARWSPDCEYVRQRKGQDFINNVQAQVNQHMETEEVNNSNTEQQVMEVNDAQALSENGTGNTDYSENLEDFDDGREEKMDE